MSEKKAVPGKDGNKYVPFEARTGDVSVVYFTRDLSEEGLKKIYDKVSKGIEGKVAIKLHTGEAKGPNIIPRPWVKALYEEKHTTLEDALSRIQSGDIISGGQYASEPMLAYRHMHEIADRVEDVTFWCGIMAEDYPFVMDEQYADRFHFLSYFYGPQLRKTHARGNSDYIPCNLRHMGQLMVDSHKPTVFMGVATPPDEDGYVTVMEE